MAWNTAKLKEFSKKMREHEEKYNLPTNPRKKKTKSTKKDR